MTFLVAISKKNTENHRLQQPGRKMPWWNAHTHDQHSDSCCWHQSASWTPVFDSCRLLRSVRPIIVT